MRPSTYASFGAIVWPQMHNRTKKLVTAFRGLLLLLLGGGVVISPCDDDSDNKLLWIFLRQKIDTAINYGYECAGFFFGFPHVRVLRDAFNATVFEMCW